MSQSQIDIARRQVSAYNDKDWDAARATMVPDYVYDEVATHRRLQGADQVLPVWQGWAAAFPDSKATFDNAVADGNTVVLELTWRGTHTGPLQTPGGTIPATGRSIEFRACQIQEVADGRVRSTRHYFDMATLLQQIGVSAAAV
jgi:steroid delta-isomerase-like uncharacterized protein